MKRLVSAFILLGCLTSTFAFPLQLQASDYRPLKCELTDKDVARLKNVCEQSCNNSCSCEEGNTLEEIAAACQVACPEPEVSCTGEVCRKRILSFEGKTFTKRTCKKIGCKTETITQTE